LHNSAIDSINSYLKWGGPGPKLTWEVFEKWCRYVYENIPQSDQGEGLRCYISMFFAFSLGFSRFHDHTKDPNASQHKSKSLSDLAIENPDLLRDAFSVIRSLKSPNTAPWVVDPCDFHIHTEDSCHDVECAASLNMPVEMSCGRFGRRTDLGLVQYFLQEMTLKGLLICDIGDITRELIMSRHRAIAAIEKLIFEEVVSWVEELQSVRLVPATHGLLFMNEP
jgi:hypothetical protein